MAEESRQGFSKNGAFASVNSFIPIKVNGYAPASLPLKMGGTAAWSILALLVTAGVVLGVLSGRFEVLVGFVAVPFLWGKAKRASGGTELKAVQATFSYDPSRHTMSVFMPGTRLWDGAYVDQLYQCHLAHIDSVFFDAKNTFYLRANPMQSFAFRGSEQLGYSELPSSEVSIKVDSDARHVITQFFAQLGIQCTQA